MTQSVMFFGLARGGSSITCRLLQIIFSGSGFDLVDIGGNAYAAGIPIYEIPNEELSSIDYKNKFVGPFRELPEKFSLYELNRFRKIFIVRDPRDCLVSTYFAMKNVHSDFKVNSKFKNPRPRTDVNLEIDEYVLQESEVLFNTIGTYLNLMKQSSDFICYRYEDIIRNPMSWLKDITNIYEIKPNRDAIGQYALEANFVNLVEHSEDHNRSGEAGGYRKHLSAEIINIIENKFVDILQYGGYIQEDAFGDKLRRFPVLDNETLIHLNALKRPIADLQRQNYERIIEISNLQRQNHERIIEISNINSKIDKIIKSFTDI